MANGNGGPRRSPELQQIVGIMRAMSDQTFKLQPSILYHAMLALRSA